MLLYSWDKTVYSNIEHCELCDYQESVTNGQSDGRTERQNADKVTPMYRYASQATQNRQGGNVRKRQGGNVKKRQGI